MKKLITSFLAITMLFTACGNEETENTPIKRDPTKFKEVEIFSFQQENTPLFIEKFAENRANNTISISPEISGKITKLDVKVGDQVKKNQLLAQIGDSLSTQSNNIQLNTTSQILNLSELQAYYSNAATSQGTYNTYLQTEAALNNYNLLVENLYNTADIFDQQLDNAYIELDNATLNLASLEDSIYDLEDQIDELEDQLDDTNDNNLENQLEAQLDQLDVQLDALELQLEIAENREQQAEIAAEQLQSNQDNQLSQLQNNIINAEIQYQSALNQLDAAYYNQEIQNIANQNQLLQTAQNLQQLQLSNSAKYITSPIDGTITAVNIEQGNNVNPGQIIITLESNTESKITTSISEEEKQFITPDNKIFDTNDTEIGQITYISPTLDPQSKKYTVEIASNQKLQTNQNQTIRIQVNNQNFIPLKAITVDGNETRIRTLTNQNQVQYRQIQTSAIIGNHIFVTKGLQKGEKVILSTEFFLEEGEKVKIKQS